MKLYEAIEQMRQISKEGGEFSFTFMGYSETAGKSDGPISVERARLRSRPTHEQNSNTYVMEAYTNLLSGEARQFYQPLLMIFNGQKIDLE
ncbi:MAG: hypothetical protein JZU47_11020 [Prolixibacteraceae bacterium]|nr:hypothetical protein [Prolixibacteraceae bacterium]